MSIISTLRRHEVNSQGSLFECSQYLTPFHLIIASLISAKWREVIPLEVSRRGIISKVSIFVGEFEEIFGMCAKISTDEFSILFEKPCGVKNEDSGIDLRDHNRKSLIFTSRDSQDLGLKFTEVLTIVMSSLNKTNFHSIIINFDSKCGGFPFNYLETLLKGRITKNVEILGNESIEGWRLNWFLEDFEKIEEDVKIGVETDEEYDENVWK